MKSIDKIVAALTDAAKDSECTFPITNYSVEKALAFKTKLEAASQQLMSREELEQKIRKIHNAIKTKQITDTTIQVLLTALELAL